MVTGVNLYMNLKDYVCALIQVWKHNFFFGKTVLIVI